MSRIIPEPCAEAIATTAKEFDGTLLVNDDTLKEFRRRLGLSQIEHTDDIARVCTSTHPTF